MCILRVYSPTTNLGHQPDVVRIEVIKHFEEQHDVPVVEVAHHADLLL